MEDYYYDVDSRMHNPEILEITMIEEGRIVKGIKNGYSRVLKPDLDSTC